MSRLTEPQQRVLMEMYRLHPRAKFSPNGDFTGTANRLVKKGLATAVDIWLYRLTEDGIAAAAEIKAKR